MTRPYYADSGFSLVELMVVVMIIGILSAMAVPMYLSAHVRAAERTCFANQRYIEGTTQVWVASSSSRTLAELAGVLNSSHPLVVENFIGHVPRCPAGQEPADSLNPTAEEGAYTLGADGSVAPCTLGELEEHGHY